MKAILPHQFILKAQKYSCSSFIIAISNCSQEMLNKPDKEFGIMARDMGSVLITQPWLLDMLYTIITLEKHGEKNITSEEFISLLEYYSDYQNKRDGKRITRHNVHLNLYGFLGEQIRMQHLFEVIDSFSREIYILNHSASSAFRKSVISIDIPKEFINITGLSLDDYNKLTIILWSKAVVYNVFNDDSIQQIPKQLPLLEQICKSHLPSIVQYYSTSVEDIKNSGLRRQHFYSKPFIEIESGCYVSANVCTTTEALYHACYWRIRDHFCKLKSQEFTNAFGICFEEYVAEVLNNCLPKGTFERISEEEHKRADWKIELGDYTFLVEQKSTISYIGIKQSESDTEKLVKYIQSCWGEAVNQLQNTQKDLHIKQAIKIILLYEDYYLGESLDTLFTSAEYRGMDDGTYWLLSIKELEMLLYTYLSNNELFFRIIKEKDDAEHSKSFDGRGMEYILNKNGVYKNEYLRKFGIINQYESVYKGILGTERRDKSKSRNW